MTIDPRIKTELQECRNLLRRSRSSASFPTLNAVHRRLHRIEMILQGE